MAKKTQVDDVLDLIVAFGNQSAGDKTARIGVTVSRGDLSLSKAEKNFCERRLRVCIVVKANGWQPDQPALPGMDEMSEELELEAVFDVKRLSFDGDNISFGLTGALGDLDVGKLAKFAKRTGRLIVREVAEIPEKEKSKENDDGDD